MELTRSRPHLTTACPGVPECEHTAAHAGPHGPVCRPETTYCAPGRCYCPPATPADPGPRRGPRWGRYAQADGELVADLLAELRDHLANLRAAAQEGRPR